MSAYQSINIIMEGDDRSGETADIVHSSSISNSNSNSNSNSDNNRRSQKNNSLSNAPSEVVCIVPNNSNAHSSSDAPSFHDEEEAPANDRTSLLKGTHNQSKYSIDNTCNNKSNSNSNNKKADSYDEDKFICATKELKKAIQHKPWLSAYIMFSTLFFGFALGFAMGYLVYEQRYFYRNGDGDGSLAVGGNRDWNTVSESDDDFYTVEMDVNINVNANSKVNTEVQEDVTSTSTSTTTTSALSSTSILESKSESARENHTESERTKETEEKVWEFLGKHLFRDLPPMASSSSTESSLLQKPPLMGFPFQGGSSTPRPLIYLNRPDAYSLLIDSISGGTIPTMSEYSNDFFLLSSGLDAQVNQAYCGVSSAMAVLNSLRFLKSTISDDGVNIPVDPVYKPYAYATQSDIFDACTEDHVISHTGGGPGVDGILTPPYGLSMPQIAGLLRCHLNTTASSGIGWSVQEQYVDKSHITPGKMRFDLKKALSDTNSRVLVNYDRSAIGQEGGGHWSPVGSYSEKQDAFLILDVAKYKYPPVWIPTERLFDGLATYDDCGLWDFPGAQDKLSEEERTAHTKEAYAATMSKLGCQKELRGYITVTRT